MNFVNKTVLILFFLTTTFSSCSAEDPGRIYIRCNQVGFLPNDVKTAVVFSRLSIKEKQFLIKSNYNNEVLFKDIIWDSLYTYDKFDHCYKIDFSELNQPGSYRIEIDGQVSHSFNISTNVFNHIVDSLMLFFKVQRCGPTDPLLHKVCHLYDASKVPGKEELGVVDLTGGWHDAGDYIKFFSTTAFATYMLLFSYDFNREKFDFDNDFNSVPDILEEARVGLDWMLRCNFEGFNLVTQVQDLRDHEVGWRLPEKDKLMFDRPGLMSIGKNQIGMFAAVMALASRIWKERFFDNEFSTKLLKAAENLYSFRNQAPDIDKAPTGFYQDQSFFGKIALGAIELYNSTGNLEYLRDAITYGDSAKADYWWSWGNINSLAHYRISKYQPRFIEYIKMNLTGFQLASSKSVFSEGAAFTWGTTNAILGVALQTILYEKLTGDHSFDSLKTFQRDYILGRNPWGISFIYNIGEVYPKYFHHQIAFYHNGYLPGGLAAGPAPASLLDDFEIERENFTYNLFNTDSTMYFDDRNDYITNEPTIVANSTAVFVFGNYSGKR